eukprot:611322-Prymnesium_polylepis.1
MNQLRESSPEPHRASPHTQSRRHRASRRRARHENLPRGLESGLGLGGGRGPNGVSPASGGARDRQRGERNAPQGETARGGGVGVRTSSAPERNVNNVWAHSRRIGPRAVSRSLACE